MLTLERMPAFCNVLTDTPAEARAVATGDLELVQCARCATIVNVGFDPDLVGYSPGYENSLHHSPTFQAWARGLAGRLVEEHGLRGGSVVELGCGGGGFLSLLCEAGMSRGLGFDPSFNGELDSSVAAGVDVEVRRGFLGAGDVVDADLAVCRHVLEHVTQPDEIVSLLRDSAPQGLVYLEVPDASTMVRDDLLYDVLYEHCTYFTGPSFRALLSRVGLRPLSIGQEFGRQYLSVVAVPGQDDAGPDLGDAEVAELLEAGEAFAERAAITISEWAERLSDLKRGHRDVVVWGAGSKGVTFVNLVDPAGAVSRLVDVNPRKWGRFVPGTAQPVVAPDDLVETPPDVVVVMNPLYREEVGEMLHRLGVVAEVLVA